jgi:hypothetical protein
VLVPEKESTTRIFVSVLGVHSSQTWASKALWKVSGEGGLRKVGRFAWKVKKSGRVTGVRGDRKR